jgi:hypothetical protein
MAESYRAENQCIRNGLNSFQQCGSHRVFSYVPTWGSDKEKGGERRGQRREERGERREERGERREERGERREERRERREGGSDGKRTLKVLHTKPLN